MAVNSKLDELRQLISDNAYDLVNGLLYYGSEQTIYQIALSHVTPEEGFYFISIDCEGTSITRELNHVAKTGIKSFQHSISLQVKSAELPTNTETQTYEDATKNLRTFCERLALLIYDNKNVDSISINYGSTQDPSTDGTFIKLEAFFTFTLKDYCG